MKFISISLLALTFTGCVSLTGFGREHEIIVIAKKIAGPSAKNCGVLHSSELRDQAFSCAYNSRPYWFAIDYGAIGWWAVAAPAVGSPTLIHPSDHYNRSSSLIIESCSFLEFRDLYDRQPIACLQKMQGGP